MAWEAYTSDVLVDMPEVTCGGYCRIRARVAYRLYCDDSNIDNPRIRIEITYFHLRSDLHVVQEPGGGYWNAAAVSWFLGAYPKMFNQSQYDLNNQRDESGHYIHTFAWPYNSSVTGSYYEEVLPSTWQNAVNDVNPRMWNGLPVFAVSVRDDLRNFSGAQVSYGRTSAQISGDPRAVLWGDVFSDTSKYNGINQNNQSKYYTTPATIDFATSALRNSSGSYLTYDNEWNTSVSGLKVGSPYTSSQCLAYIEIDKTTMDSRGLIKYDPDFFSGNGVSSSYAIDGYIVPFTWWARSRNSVLEPRYYSTIFRNSSSEQEVVLEYEDFDIPSYDPPDPVGVIDDNTVFRLVRSGNRLVWTRCERIGQE